MGLREKLERIRANQSHPSGEEQTKIAYVLPILSRLGWDQMDHSRFRIEEPVGGEKKGKVDIALRSPSQGRYLAFIEVKAPRPTIKLEDHVDQLFGYGFREGVDICVLTNGLEWWLYLPREKGGPEKCRFATLNVISDRLDLLVEDFETFLALDKLESNDAEARAKQVLEERFQSEKLQEKLPQIWKKIITDPPEELINLVVSRVLESIKVQPSSEQIVQFLSGQKPHEVSLSHKSFQSTDKQNLSKVKTSAKIATSPAKPTAYSLFGVKHSANSMAQIWFEITEELYNRHSNRFTRIVGKPHGRRSFIEMNDSQKGKHRRIKNSEFWIEAYGSSESMIWRCKNILKLLGYKESDLIIHYD